MAFKRIFSNSIAPEVLEHKAEESWQQYLNLYKKTAPASSPGNPEWGEERY